MKAVPAKSTAQSLARNAWEAHKNLRTIAGEYFAMREHAHITMSKAKAIIAETKADLMQAKADWLTAQAEYIKAKQLAKR